MASKVSMEQALAELTGSAPPVLSFPPAMPPGISWDVFVGPAAPKRAEKPKRAKERREVQLGEAETLETRMKLLKLAKELAEEGMIEPKSIAEIAGEWEDWVLG